MVAQVRRVLSHILQRAQAHVQSLSDAARRVPDTSKRTLPILTGCKGVLKPGTTTLLLAPPGHGKTSFLRALCGRVPAANVSGSISYSGADQKELKAKGVFLQLLANYVSASVLSR